MRRRVRERSPFPAEETAKLLAVRFDHMPQRLAAALEHLDALLRRAGYRPVQTVPLVPAKLRRVPIPERFASRVIVEAVPDAQLIETMHRSEQRNKHLIA